MGASQLMAFLVFITFVIDCVMLVAPNNHKKYYLIVLLFILCKLIEMAVPVSLAANLNATTADLFDNNELNGFTTMARFRDAPPVKGWSCYCWNSTNEFAEELECRCEGDALLRIPQKLQLGMNRLTITKAGLPLLRNTGLKLYGSTLRDVTLTDLSNFESIQPGAFESVKNLRTIYISHAPKLVYLTKDVFYGIADTIKTIRIINTGLVKVPDFRYLSTGTILHMIDLEGNKIDHVDSFSVNVKTEQLILDNNDITSIADSAFYGSEIGKLLKGNTKLQYIHPKAFVGIHNIQELDLSSTSLLAIPWEGLQSLEILRIQRTHSLKTIPSIYEFKNLQVAWLTHPFHCCAFKFPSRHDPVRHALRLKYLAEVKQTCLGITASGATKSRNGATEVNTDPIEVERKNGRKTRNAPLMTVVGSGPIFSQFINDNISSRPISFPSFHEFGNPTVEAITGSSVVIIDDDSPFPEDYRRQEDFGEFHEATANIEANHQLDAMCGNITEKKIDVSCFPMPDALNPCEDVMGSYWLRISVWLVVLLAVFGNIAVLIVILSNRSDFTVSKFLMSNLAFADLCMGLYLLFIASIDAHSIGEYFNYAYDWQYGTGCKVAGFLTVFASHLSVFTLTIITLERWFAITNAIYLNKRIKMKQAMYIMIGGWIYASFMSSFPLFGISNYSSTSICLPMEARDSFDVIYLVAILAINGAAFFVIAICYAQIYFSLGKETRRGSRHTGEMTVAKKMALLVFTNFSCWAPIGFFGLTALAGYPLINVTKSKILLVFFYPLNSCADPYLYAILTTQYRRDLYILLSKLGICKRRARQYRNNCSQPATNTSYPLSTAHRSSLNPAQKTAEDHLVPKEDFV
ncbi:thyrotropin receptor isoform X2 [Hermetia illucens]|uniref:thyrotropin receptor isoform X2 n=1 Tax=Hermetia illucens TaxID=343691 RepID=UPI0018CC63A4|nr:thyrotropin receptor isoform X2 [Hermetia illucens]